MPPFRPVSTSKLIIHYSYHEISSLVILILLIISYFFGNCWELSSHTPQKHLKWRTNCSGVCSLTWSLSVCITSYSSPCFVYINVVWTENRTRIKMQQCPIFFSAPRPGPKCTKLQVWKHPEATRHKKVIFPAARGHRSPQFTVNKLLLWHLEIRGSQPFWLVLTWLKTKRGTHTNRYVLWDQM